MTYDLLSALALFAFVSSITPGPNNLMLMTSGANFGLRRSVPHMLGVTLGFIAMVILVGLGLAQIFERFPIANRILEVASVLYMAWLAWKIANASTVDGGHEAAGTPMTFLQAAAFQWVNPKAWAMALTAITVYASVAGFTGVVVTALVFGAINLPCITFWTTLGTQIKRVLTTGGRLRWFNRTMAALLIVSLWPVLAAAH